MMAIWPEAEKQSAKYPTHAARPRRNKRLLCGALVTAAVPRLRMLARHICGDYAK